MAQTARRITVQHNIVRKWKDEHGLKEGVNQYFNPTKSPDLSVIENSFQPLKQKLSIIGHWDPESLRRRAEEIWDHEVSQEYTNKQVKSMEDRMHEVLDGDGRMIGH